MGKYNFFNRVALICSIFFLFEEDIKADTGCLYNGQVYRVAPTWSNWFWTSPMQVSCPPNASPSTVYAKVDPGSGNSCAVSWSGSGREVSYRVANCPIDDYIPFLFLAVTGFCFYSFYNRKFSLIN